MQYSAKIPVPLCEFCKSPMKFYDEAWPEAIDTVIASVICSNDNCTNTSVIYFHLMPDSVSSKNRNASLTPRGSDQATARANSGA